MLDIGILAIISAIQIVGIAWLVSNTLDRLGYKLKITITLAKKGGVKSKRKSHGNVVTFKQIKRR